jgi:uncharacterized protein (DUF697 family)
MSEKETQAQKVIRNYMLWSLGAGLVPVPVLDLAAVSGVQLKMLAEISKVYGVPFEESRGKAVIGSLIGFVLPHTLSAGAIGSLLKLIPGFGALVGSPTVALFAAAYAWALGRVFIQHFESGGTFLSFRPDDVREYFRAQFEEGQKAAAAMQAEEQAKA